MMKKLSQCKHGWSWWWLCLLLVICWLLLILSRFCFHVPSSGILSEIDSNCPTGNHYERFRGSWGTEKLMKKEYFSLLSFFKRKTLIPDTLCWWNIFWRQSWRDCCLEAGSRHWGLVWAITRNRRSSLVVFQAFSADRGGFWPQRFGSGPKDRLIKNISRLCTRCFCFACSTSQTCCCAM